MAIAALLNVGYVLWAMEIVTEVSLGSVHHQRPMQSSVLSPSEIFVISHSVLPYCVKNHCKWK